MDVAAVDSAAVDSGAKDWTVRVRATGRAAGRSNEKGVRIQVEVIAP